MMRPCSRVNLFHEYRETLPMTRHTGGRCRTVVQPFIAGKLQTARRTNLQLQASWKQPWLALQAALPGMANLPGFKPAWKPNPDNYSSLAELQDALRQEGLETSSLIVAVDFTKSNEWTGKNSFNGKSLHSIGTVPNPYVSSSICMCCITTSMACLHQKDALCT